VLLELVLMAWTARADTENCIYATTKKKSVLFIGSLPVILFVIDRAQVNNLLIHQCVVENL
jgi:hypothetical protein